MTKQTQADHNRIRHAVREGFPSSLAITASSLLCFSVTWLLANTWYYPEGDHAFTISYHLFGRRDAFQPPYSPYYALVDFFLRPFPAQEAVLRVASKVITMVGTVLSFILLTRLAQSIVNRESPPTNAAKITNSWALAPVLFLSIPDFVYQSLIFSPAMLSLMFMLAAHLSVLSPFRTVSGWRSLLLRGDRKYVTAGVLFALAVASAWYAAPYALVLMFEVGHTRVHDEAKGQFGVRSAFLFASYWLGAVICGTVALVVALGFGPNDFIAMVDRFFEVSHTHGGSDLFDVLSILAGLTQVFTPVILVLGAIGAWRILVRGGRLRLLLLCSLPGLVLPVVTSGLTKHLIVVFPAIAISFAHGLRWVESRVSPGRNNAAVWLSLSLLVLAPWFIGITVSSPNAAWGPGYQLKDYDFEAESSTRRISLVFGPGRAIHANEGSRPLHGHAFVFVPQLLRQQRREFAAEQNRALSVSDQSDLPLVSINWPESYFVNELVRQGYMTDDPDKAPAPWSDMFTERTFQNSEGDVLTIIHREIVGTDVQELLPLASLPHPEVVLYAYPEQIRAIHLLAPNSLSKIGSVSALFRPETFAAAIGL